MLPRLPSGAVVGVHDIYLPEDYGPDAAALYWSEQYVFGVALLAGRDRIRPLLASHYLFLRPDLRDFFLQTWEEIGLGGTFAYGSTFWFEADLGR